MVICANISELIRRKSLQNSNKKREKAEFPTELR